MKLELKRYIIHKSGTIGKLFVDGTFFCYTLEDKIRPSDEPKVSGDTAIPVGTYKVTITHSTKFKTDLPLLHDVPNFRGIRIHAGNTTKDTEGCILVGETYEGVQVKNSRKALVRLLAMLQKSQDSTIQIS